MVSTVLKGFVKTIGLLVLSASFCAVLFAGYLFFGAWRGWYDGASPSDNWIPSASSDTSDAPDSDGASEADRLDPPSLPPAAGSAANPVNPARSANPPKPRWDQQERVNFLLMGIDRRPGEKGATQTDTMIVVTLDPATKSVGMLSIPRDLWVTIPGFSENRINTAYYIGVKNGYRGGGAALVKKTIQQNLGIPIHYYVMINFVGFRKLVDALGGISIDVPKDIYDPTFPDDRYGYRPLIIHKGLQRMNGQQALDFARTRHVDTDFGRMRRQQQVVMAIKEQALRIDVLTKIPALWAAKSDMAETDLSLNDIIALVQAARDVKPENVRSGVIGDAETADWVTPGGAMVLLPNRDRIRRVVEQVFKTSVSVLAQAEPGDQFRRLAGEGARLEISNGTGVEGLGGRVSEWLKAQGFNVVLVDSADRNDYPQTLLMESALEPYTRGLLFSILHVPSDRSRKTTTAENAIDIRIILGHDFDASMLPNSQ